MKPRLHLLEQARAVAVVRSERTVDLVRLVDVLSDAGWAAVEITATTPGVYGAVERARERLDRGALIGVGTVLDTSTAERAVNAGAQMLLSPGFVPGLSQWARTSEVITVSGAFTPTEVMAAHSDGADVVKVFPVGPMGPGYIADLMAPLGHIPLMPMGGVDARNAADYLAAGAMVVGIGSAAIDYDALRVGDWQAVSLRAARCRKAIDRV